ncbi:hypothetical protein AAFF_G00373850 [Aldrovandia affinis]|uniref:C-type lectin domain-containing protein n=1 Tax=Aldrovandia affinis TaxID=143900 RepID=A0AAD7R4F9_9TELE|nr:hypothetical protein AAFF_G00373850 [Aldrovandia affinis]
MFVTTETSGQSSFLKRLAAVCPWLLCALLLTAAVVLGVLYMRASPNCSMRCVEELVKFPFLDQYCPLRSQKRVCRPCPEGWKQRNSKCYYFSTERKNWQGSRSACLKQGADLVIIESEEEQDFISKHTRGNYAYWIGLSDSETEGTWLWVDGTPLQEDKAFWKKGEPNNYNGAEDCAATQPGRISCTAWHFIGGTGYSPIQEIHRQSAPNSDPPFGLCLLHSLCAQGFY